MRSTKRNAGERATGENRLRNEIVGGALAVTFTLLFMFAGFAYWQGHKILTAEGLKSLEGMAAVQEARVTRYVEDGVEDLNLVTTRAHLKNGLVDYSRNGEAASVEEIRLVVDESRRVSRDVVFIRVFDSGLEEVALGAPPTAVIPAGYLEGARSGTITGLVVENEAGSYVHLVAGPVVSDSDVVGVVVVGQSTDPLFELVGDRRGLGETGETILAQSHRSGATYIAPLRFDRTAVLGAIPSEIDGLPMSAAVMGVESETSHGVDYRGNSVFAVTKHIDGPDWGLVVKKDRSEILGPMEEFGLLALGVLAVGLVFAYFLTARFTERTMRPVREVTATAKAIAAGHRNLRVASSRQDEIGELARSFDEMTAQLNALTSELEDRVEARTRELQDKNAELARVMQDKETFLAGVSHEVRSPLTAMIGFLDLVNEAGESLTPDERTEMLETVSRQADDVLNLIEDLLASARVEAGTLSVVTVRSDLAAQVRQVVESIAPSTRVEIELTGDGAIADADPARVRQIIRNLLTNADRYGGDHVVVEVSRVQGVARIQVRDDGPGVPEQDRVEIFEPYGQSEANRRVDGSVGLGLHVSRELARLMGGDLAYDYSEGWSVFSLVLPEHFDEAASGQHRETAGVFSG